MNPTLLRTSRWALMLLLSTTLGYLLFASIRGLVTMDFSADAPLALGLRIGISAFGFVLLALVPAIALHSLITKNLKGFAACVGLVLALTAFYAAFQILRGWIAAWPSIPLIPDAVEAIGGIVLSIGLLLLPFWLVSRIIRLTNEWIYPAVFKPLEEKL